MSKRQIFLGLYNKEKEAIIQKASKEYDKIILISPTKEELHLNVDCEIVEIKYSHSDHIKVYYELLKHMKKSTLLVLNESIRAKQGNIKNNCFHMYSKNCGGVLLFNHFPVISDKEDIYEILNIVQGDKYVWNESTYQKCEFPVIARKHTVELKVHDEYTFDEKHMETHKKFVNYICDKLPYDKEPVKIYTAVEKKAIKDKAHLKSYGELKLPKNNIIFLDRIKDKKSITFVKTNLGIDELVYNEKRKVVDSIDHAYDLIDEMQKVRWLDENNKS